MLRQPEPAYFDPRRSLETAAIHFQNSEVDKTQYPLLYVFWDSCLQDANALIMAGDAAESRRFRGTLVRSFLLHMLWPELLSVVFVMILFYYPTYMIWFAWVGFVLFIFALYRVKEFFDTFYYLSNPVTTLFPSPGYYETHPAPPPAYSVDQNAPPTYVSVMTQLPRTTSC
ncbi:hypothetical protein DSO57_1015147 [Entomophthora muscae]|uniref:Uncharacterized protein n=1 Tax=Entomophthora muscae TaxID=34485 RepID=A0ACC2UQ92_9FUNG|nr:hypothetical protein DSO57_1015147 [Entomophthora muscae]